MPTILAKDGVELHYEFHDYTDPWKKAPVLFLQHGLARSARFWYNMVPYLSRYYKIVCADLRGCGEAPANFNLKTGLTVENYISDFVAIIDALGHDDVHFAGESIGGNLGLVFAAKHPKRVRTLTMFSSPLIVAEWLRKTFAFEHPSWVDALRKMGSVGWSNAVLPMPDPQQNLDAGIFDWYRREMGKSKVEVLIAMAELVPSVDATPFLKHVECPVLGVFPDQGPATPDQLETMQRELRNFQLIRMAKLPLTVQTIAPATCAKHLLHFISAHDGVTCHEL